MRRILCAILALMMVFSISTTVSARTLDVATNFVPNPMILNLPVTVLARQSGSGAAFKTSLSTTKTVSNPQVDIDYNVTLNMQPVRDLFDERFISLVIANDTEAKTEYEAGIVSTTVNVEIEYPSSAIAKVDPQLSTTGTLNASAIFSETARVLDGNKLTITFENNDSLTVAELTAYREAYLADISFELADAVAYNASGTHNVKVTLSGSTLIDFATKDQVVNYTGTDTHSLKHSVRSSSSSTSSDTVSYKTIKFNSNGGTQVPEVKVESGNTIIEPTTTREGYEFAGWYSDSELTKKFDFSAPIKTTMTLYAKWDIIKTPVEPSKDKFLDLEDHEWAKEAINYLADLGVIQGVSADKYEPGWGIKRGDIALLMVRLFSLTSDSTDVFEDVPADMYYSEACRIGKAHGVLLGVNDDHTLYEPERIILRQEMAALIVRSLITMGYIDGVIDTNVSMYVDADDIEAYAVPYVAFLTSKGIVQGDPDGSFRPLDTITRAEAAQVLYNLYITFIAK